MFYESPAFALPAAPSDATRIEPRAFGFGKAVPGVRAAVLRVRSNHGGGRTGLSAAAFTVSGD